MVFFARYNYRKDKYFFVVSWPTTVSVLTVVDVSRQHISISYIDTVHCPAKPMRKSAGGGAT